jgi:hypothetical protein
MPIVRSCAALYASLAPAPIARPESGGEAVTALAPAPSGAAR